MEHRKQAVSEAVELRDLTSRIEVRSIEGKDPELFGYALKFGVRYDMGWFTEEIHRDALNKADMQDVRVLFNHDSNQILGRTVAGTARVGIDDVGMWYSVTLPKSPTGENVRVAVERGDVNQSSWGFSIPADSDKWENTDGKKAHRTITAIARVYDVSPVTFPANPDTSVAKRSFDAYSQPIEDAAEQTEQRDTNEQINTELQVSIALLERQLDYLNLTT